MRAHTYVYIYGTSTDCVFFFFFNDTATTEIYTLSLHDALPISPSLKKRLLSRRSLLKVGGFVGLAAASGTLAWLVESQVLRSEEHTSELQSQSNLVCRLLLEKKKPSCLCPPSRPSRTRSALHRS